MKKFNTLFATFLCAFIVCIAGANIVLIQQLNIEQKDSYKVVLNRIEQEIRLAQENKKSTVQSMQEIISENLAEDAREFGIEILAIEALDIASSTSEEIADWLESENVTYQLFSTGKTLYKVSYRHEGTYETDILWYFNGIAIVLLVVFIAVFLYIKQSILKPFYEFSNLPYELAKGNLTRPLKENKNRYFGRFLWGMDLLREHMEEAKQKELELQKEKKMLLISLSHDIKTPLNAISLYAKAISKNLYKDEAKKIEVAENIHAKVGEIEGYMAEIVKASNEDFLNFEVKNEEFYSKEVLSYIEEYYMDKMELNQIEFSIGEYRDCLLFGDKERLIEVLQNLIENAIKYGDGKKICIKALKQDDAYEILVQNTGCTLDKTELTHIFDSFYRGSNVENQKGSGLGLFISRKLMHLMEGEILADILSAENEQIMEVKVILRYI